MRLSKELKQLIKKYGKKGTVILLNDTSASMRIEDLQENEQLIEKYLKRIKAKPEVVINFNGDIVSIRGFEKEHAYSGGVGTNFKAPLKYIDNFFKDCSLAIFFTDGYGEIKSHHFNYKVVFHLTDNTTDYAKRMLPKWVSIVEVDRRGLWFEEAIKTLKSFIGKFKKQFTKVLKHIIIYKERKIKIHNRMENLNEKISKHDCIGNSD